jgi:3-phosphoglycerate kinase
LDRILGRAGEVSVAICGGSKVEDKLPMLKTLSRRVDLIAIGGNNVNAIAKDPSLLDGIRGNRAEILIMSDGFGNASPDDPPLYAADAAKAPHNLFDAGPASLNKLAAWLTRADIVFWNGALGITEHPFYRNGSESLVHLLKQCPGDVVIGGGDTAGFVSQFPEASFYHVSTGGGASIDYLTQETLVGITYYDESNRPEASPKAGPAAVLKGAAAAVPDLKLT